VQDELNITRSLTFNAGFRYDYYNRVQASLDPRAALIYRPWPETAFKLIYGEAFRIPNVFELYYSVPNLLPNPSLRPEKIRSTELVWEQAISHSLWLSTAAFLKHMDGMITEVPTATNELIFQNVQDVNATGVELELSAQLPKGMEGNVSYSFQQTKDAATNEFLSNSPRNLVKLGLTQPVVNRKMFFSLDAQYRSRIQSLDSGSVSPFTVVNAALLCRNLGKHLDVSAAVYNVFDRKYFDPPSSENLQLPIQQDGRGFRFKLTWHWGEP
jgi:iron complex outermembrane receptor protein